MIVVKVGGSEGIDLGAVCARYRRAAAARGSTSCWCTAARTAPTRSPRSSAIRPSSSPRSPATPAAAPTARRCGSSRWSTAARSTRASSSCCRPRASTPSASPGSTAACWRASARRRIKVIENGRRRVMRDDYTGTVRDGQRRPAAPAAGQRLSAGGDAAGHQHRERGHQRGRRPRRGHDRRRAAGRARSSSSPTCRACCASSPTRAR